MKKKKFYKKKKELRKLPNNSRSITEKLFTDHTVFLLGLIGITLAIVIVSFDLYRNLKLNEELVSERVDVLGSLEFWNQEVIDKPNYRDGYFSLALIYYKLGDVNSSSENLETALRIDPNFDRGKDFKLYLISSY